MNAPDMRRLRGSALTMIFQDPMTSLNPVFTVGQQLDDVMRAHGKSDPALRRRRGVELLESVGIPVRPLASTAIRTSSQVACASG